MIRSRLKHTATLILALTLTFTSVAEVSAAPSEYEPPPARQLVDENGIDLVSGNFVKQGTYIKQYVGDFGDPLTYSISAVRDSNSYRKISMVNTAPNYVAYTTDNGTREFLFDSNNNLIPRILSGYFVNPQSNNMSITDRDGSIYTFMDQLTSYEYQGTPIASIEKPNGFRMDYNYKIVGTSVQGYVLESITTNAGWQMKFDFVSNSDGGTTSRVTAINMALDYCDPVADTCAATANWGKATFGASPSVNGFQATDPSGVGSFWKFELIPFTQQPNGVSGSIGTHTFGPSSSSTQILVKEIFYCIDAGDKELIAADYVVRDGKTWDYNVINCQSSQRTMTVTDPLGGVRTVVVNPVLSQVVSDTDENNRTISYHYDSGGRRDRITFPEGNYVQYTYDGRGNATEIRQVAKSGSGLADIVRTATFPSSCTYPKTCNQPTSTTDANGKTANFTYDHAHGGILSEMAPPAASGGARPLKLTTWSQRYAWVKNSSGTLVQAATPIWVMATQTQCQTVTGGSTPVCDSSAPQVVTTFEYGTTGTAEALRVKGVTVASGGTTLRTCFTYDSYNRKISETNPSAGLSSCP